MEYVTVKSFDNKIIKVPKDKKDVYLKNQEKIREIVNKGKSIEEILKIMKEEK